MLGPCSKYCFCEHRYVLSFFFCKRHQKGVDSTLEISAAAFVVVLHLIALGCFVSLPQTRVDKIQRKRFQVEFIAGLL